MEDILLALKSFLTTSSDVNWNNIIWCLIIFGVIIMLMLAIKVIKKTNKEIQDIKRKKRKRDKKILKFLSNKNKSL